MSRVACILVLVLSAVCLAGPALAQRDPFEPAIEEGAQPGATAVDDITPDEEPEPAAPASERLANTGADPIPWTALAYTLIALGVATVVVTRVARPGTK